MKTNEEKIKDYLHKKFNEISEIIDYTIDFAKDAKFTSYQGFWDTAQVNLSSCDYVFSRYIKPYMKKYGATEDELQQQHNRLVSLKNMAREQLLNVTPKIVECSAYEYDYGDFDDYE